MSAIRLSIGSSVLYNELMTTEVSVGKKLNDVQRMQVLAMLARGDTVSQINEYLEKNYDITLTAGAFTDMKKRHSDTLDAMRSTIQETAMTEVDALMNKSRRILSRKLDRADRDMTALEELDEQYRNGDIDSAEYKRKKATLLNVSITEIAMVSKNLHDQSKKSDDPNDPSLPAGNPRQTEALLNAIKKGDTVELQRIILNPPSEILHPVTNA